MATSRVLATKAALVDLLAARPGLDGVQVTWGVDALADEAVVVGNVTPSTQQPAALGRLRREEAFTVEVVVTCIAPVEDSQRELTTRAFALAGELEELLRADCSLGGAVRVAEIGGISLQEPADEVMREARLVVPVKCNERI